MQTLRNHQIHQVLQDNNTSYVESEIFHSTVENTAANHANVEAKYTIAKKSYMFEFMAREECVSSVLSIFPLCCALKFWYDT